MSANASDTSQSNSYNTRSTQNQNAQDTQQHPPTTQQNPATTQQNLPATQQSLPATQQSLPPTQQNPPSTQSSSSSQKIWALSKGTMRIVGHGKKKPSDLHMVLQLEFTFENDPRTRKVGKASLYF